MNNKEVRISRDVVAHFSVKFGNLLGMAEEKHEWVLKIGVVL
jgi:hypothetical protein